MQQSATGSKELEKALPDAARVANYFDVPFHKQFRKRFLRA